MNYSNTAHTGSENPKSLDQFALSPESGVMPILSGSTALEKFKALPETERFGRMFQGAFSGPDEKVEHWLNTTHAQWRVTPRAMILCGRMNEVLDFIRSAIK
jgi:hypothetical protein